MSNAGRGKPNRIPITVGIPPNGGSPPVPDDLVWDADNPPFIFPCSQHTDHAPGCPGQEDGMYLDSESQVDLLNEGRAWARAGMNFKGIPESLEGMLPIPGIRIELVDMLMWAQVLKEVVQELAGITPYELEEKFRERKIMFLREIREANEAQVRRQRTADALGIVQKPPLLGPNGQPI